MRLIAIDPGTTESAFVEWDGSRVLAKGLAPNEELLRSLRRDFDPTLLLAIEKVESYGMPVGREVFETVWWAGRFAEAHSNRGGVARMVPRRVVKLHLCQSNKAKDSNIWQALVDRFGPPGTKAQPGVLHGVHSHARAALALAVTVSDECDRLPLTPNVYPADSGEDAA